MNIRDKNRLDRHTMKVRKKKREYSEACAELSDIAWEVGLYIDTGKKMTQEYFEENRVLIRQCLDCESALEINILFGTQGK